MPSNIQTLNELSSIQITKSEIDTIPNYLRKFKEDSSKDIANWLLNSKSSSVSEISLISGPGISYKSNGVAPLFESYSALILGKTGFQNRWQVNFIKDKSIRDDDFAVTYFDGNNHFKRFSVEASSGTIKSRSSDFRNGNTVNCNANYQIALGYSETASFNDYSIYRHNFRTNHTNNTSLNYENAVDLYLWDNSNDLPNDIGSRHVVRWDALGNEELIKGTRIDGGINLDISSDSLKITEKNLLAVKDKGVIYYNKSSKTFRYSVDGELFNDFGKGSGSGASIESCPISMCSRSSVDIPNNVSYGTAFFSESGITISDITICAGLTHDENSRIDIAVYVCNSANIDLYLNGIQAVYGGSGAVVYGRNSNTRMIKATLTNAVVVPENHWYVVVITYNDRLKNKQNLEISSQVSGENRSVKLYGFTAINNALGNVGPDGNTDTTGTNFYIENIMDNFNGSTWVQQRAPMAQTGATTYEWNNMLNTTLTPSTFVPYIKIGAK